MKYLNENNNVVNRITQVILILSYLWFQSIFDH